MAVNAPFRVGSRKKIGVGIGTEFYDDPIKENCSSPAKLPNIHENHQAACIPALGGAMVMLNFFHNRLSFFGARRSPCS